MSGSTACPVISKFVPPFRLSDRTFDATLVSATMLLKDLREVENVAIWQQKLEEWVRDLRNGGEHQQRLDKASR
jgi:hypothetical protein